MSMSSLGGLAPALHLLWLQTKLPAAGSEFSGLQSICLSTTMSLVGVLQLSVFFSDAGTTSPGHRHAFMQLKRIAIWMPSSSEIQAML